MMRKVLNTVNMDGVIVIGEGEKDEVNFMTCLCVVRPLPVLCRGMCHMTFVSAVGLMLVQAPMLYCGEQIGNGTLEPQVDIAVDPLDGTTSIALVGCSIFHLFLTWSHRLVRIATSWQLFA